LFLQNLHFSTGVGGHGFLRCPYLRLGIAHTFRQAIALQR
jgi:hypothetical protein